MFVFVLRAFKPMMSRKMDVVNYRSHFVTIIFVEQASSSAARLFYPTYLVF